MTINILKKLGLIRDKKKKKNKKSKDVAKERLQFILVQDRVKLSPAEMDDMQEELLGVIKKYIDVDDQQIEMEVNREEEMMALTANFPLKN